MVQNKIFIGLIITFLFLGKNYSQTAMELTKMKVLYAGIENPLSVACVEDFDSIYIEGASIKEIENTEEKKISPKFKRYVVNPSIDKSANIKKNLLIYKNGKVISKSEVRIKRLPDPTGALDGFANGLIVPKAILKSVSQIFAKKPDEFDLNVSYFVTKWNITILNSDKVLSASGSGAFLSPEAINFLSNTESGSRIFIDVNASAPDGTIRQISISLKVN